MILGNSAIGSTGLGNFSDPYFNYVTLLVTGANGSNATSNNTFVDNSQYSQTITRNGDATQGSFTPYNANYYSNYFDGSGDFLNFSGVTIGTNAYTIEFWFYHTGSFAAAYGIFSTSNNNALNIRINNSTTFAIDQSAVAQTTFTVPTMSANTWYHVAVVRNSSNVTTVFLNGTRSSTGTVTMSTNYNAASNYIGRIGANYYPGYISNLRVLVGTALYDPTQTSLAVPVTPLTAITNTSLLTCQNNRFIDNSLNNFTITRNGDVSVQTFNPFVFQGLPYAGSINGGSMYFDGTGDWLSVTDNNTLRLSTGNFTIELWAYVTGGSSWRALLSKGSSTTGWSIIISNTGVWAFSNATTNTLSSITVQNNVWVHLALVRVGTTATLYVNGVSAATATVSTDFNQTDVLYIGCGRAADIPFTGYISDVRILKGIALYTTTFTPPIAPLQPIENTVLLVRGTNASIFDRKEINNLIAGSGSQLSTVQTRFNNTSLFIPGTSLGAVVFPYSSANSWLTTTFTIECWVYVAARSASETPIFSQTVPTTSSFAFQTLCISNAGVLRLDVRPTTGGGVTSMTGGTVPLTTWTYVAVSVNAGSARIFVNGTQVGSTTSFTFMAQTLPTMNGIGGYGNGYNASAGANTLNGYIDDLVITRGISKYNSNFSVPTYSPLGF